jgi:ABC transporter substrate binding protein
LCEALHLQRRVSGAARGKVIGRLGAPGVAGLPRVHPRGVIDGPGHIPLDGETVSAAFGAAQNHRPRRDAGGAALQSGDAAGGGSHLLHLLGEGAAPLSVESIAGPVHERGEIERTIEAFARGSNGGLLVLPDNFINAQRKLIVALAEKYRLPAIYPFRFFVSDGGLLSYGVDVVDMYRGAASYVDRILKGAKPGDLPVQQPTKFELVINLKTAKALGLDVPPALLARTDEVIE